MIAWNEHTASHLFRRAGFGATAADLHRALDDGLEATVERLLDYERVPNDDLEQRLSTSNFDLTRPGGLIGWWVTRMIWTARPLEERMTLFLHDHFATSIGKVNDPALMLQQNGLLRRFATGNFEALSVEISRDPAMLIWLDNWLSRKEHPNENFGRELLELFLLGEGVYTEEDVLAAARAFTGWSIRSRRNPTFLFRPAWHDYGAKEFLGETGLWDGGDIVRIACSHPAHARFVARKVFAWLAHDQPDDATIEHLAATYRNSGRELAPLIRAILLSPEMYSERALWTKVKSPLDFLVTAARQLELQAIRPSAVGALNAQGQVPFAPPDVDGWPDGLAWINSATLLSRMNLSNLFIAGFDPGAFVSGPAPSTPAGVVDAMLHRLGPLHLNGATRQLLEGYLAPGGVMPTGAAAVARQRGLAQMILSLPEWQLN